MCAFTNSGITSVEFEVTTDWQTTSTFMDTSGEALPSDIDLSDPAAAAAALTSSSTYGNKIWLHS